jgi:hypothetical protein
MSHEDAGDDPMEEEFEGDDLKELPSRDVRRCLTVKQTLLSREQASPAIPNPNEESDLEAATPTATAPAQERDPDGKQAYLDYIQSLPYECESFHEMNDKLDLILRRIMFGPFALCLRG